MMTTKTMTNLPIKHPLNINSREFTANQYAYYQWLRQEAPVYKGKVSIINAYLLSRYEDCVWALKDPRFVRNRTTATGESRMPFPMPKSVAFLAQSMIVEDEPAHRRLRNLVHKAFTPRALAQMEERIERLTHELLDKAEQQGGVDLMSTYALPIPVTVISEMVGVADADMPKFRNSMQVLTKGFSGWTLFRTFFWDMPSMVRFVRDIIARKRADPQDDILTALIHAEEEGEQLSEDELISMVFLLIIAGYETTVHLITNSVVTLLQHPAQLAHLRAQLALMESAVEEVLRYNGPVQGTKPGYAMEDITLHGVTIPRGAAVMPLLGAANHDPAVFANPEVFDIARTPNKHLGFGQGIHYCLGAPLARMETRIALKNLLDRNPNLRLAVRPEELRLQNVPLWRRYERLPIVLG
ncbi:MAG: cytochrome P450 [Chloroflexales bacterium]|nr:cytochrome P450 [Chloroflexales bacterium]